MQVASWTAENFVQGGALIYIGAAGIAVRSIAPCVKSKWKDPAVLVMDEKGQFIVPILSGHVGEANQLSCFLADEIDAKEVLTTATDVNDLFAVDVFAMRNHMKIMNPKNVKKFSAHVLRAEQAKIAVPVQFASFLSVPRELPKELSDVGDSYENHSDVMLITPEKLPQQTIDNLVQLVPRVLIVGIGCRRNKGYVELLEAMKNVLSEHHLYVDGVCAIASIDVKKAERGIVRLASHFRVPFLTFSAQQLQEQEGEFSESEFVEETVGVGNVCERAVMAAGAEKLIVPKCASNGITIAIGIRKQNLKF